MSYNTDVNQSVTTWNLVHMYVGSRCHTPLAQSNEVLRPNPRIVEVVTISGNRRDTIQVENIN